MDPSSRRLVVSYSKSPLLEVFALASLGKPANACSIGLIRGPSTEKQIGEKSKGKRLEGLSPFEEDSWARSICVDVGFVKGKPLEDKCAVLAGAWNGDNGGKIAFVPFYLEDINVL